MKKLFRLFVNILAVALLCSICLGVTGCSKDEIKTVELKVQVYNLEDDVASTKTIKVNLHRNVAPKTVDAIINLVNDGYYDRAVFYMLSEYPSQIMVGDLKTDEDGVLFNSKAPQLPYSEFTYGGTTNSNLTNKSGAVGLWRSYYAKDASSTTYKTTSDAMKSGRGTWYMPTTEFSAYNGYMCVFGMIDLEDEQTAQAIELIKEVLNQASCYTSYTIYYTGEYDASNPEAEDGYGLKFNCVKTEDFDADTEYFTAKDKQLVCYNKYNVKVPNLTDSGKPMARIESAKVI